MGRLAEQDQTIDRELDRMQTNVAKAGGVLVDSRLSGWLIDGDLRTWFRAPLAVRAARVAARDGLSVEEALLALRGREESERRRYQAIYQIDLSDLGRYHLVVDTSVWSAPEIVGALLLLARRFERQ
jgi:cytidylate kinase